MLESELSPFYLAVHDKKYTAPPNLPTLILKSSSDKSQTFTLSNYSNPDSTPLLQIRRGVKSLVIILDPSSSQTIAKLDTPPFTNKRIAVDGSKHKLYKLEQSIENEKRTFTATVRNLLDGLEYVVKLQTTREYWEFFVVVNAGERRVVAVCDRIRDPESDNGFSYQMHVSEGFDLVLLMMLTMAANGGASKLTNTVDLPVKFRMMTQVNGSPHTFSLCLAHRIAHKLDEGEILSPFYVAVLVLKSETGTVSNYSAPESSPLLLVRRGIKSLAIILDPTP
ncbi:hypothetical protein BJ742DRAFT_746255 [Cladochytrium replicatum]|nr:hypothetical protein BJ742DRAFT_746255 [Cladochytrium replicatum]